MSNKKSKGSERSNNDDSFERLLADNIACYATIEISNLSSSGSSNEGSTISGGDLNLGIGGADNNDVDIPDICRNLFNHMMNEIEDICLRKKETKGNKNESINPGLPQLS